MKQKSDLNELVTRAKLGQREDTDKLIKSIQPRVRAYIYRSTLNDEVTEDLVQETLLQMLKSISNLQNVESFWSWIYRIASGKVNDYFRAQKRSRTTHFSTLEDSLLESVLKDDFSDESESITQNELVRLVINAMSKLKHQQRAVIALRCFDGMSYSQIAQSFGCSEARARVSFFRAKNTIRKHLASQGFSKSTLIMAIVLFGKLTAPSRAAAALLTANAEVMKIGGLWGILTSLTKSQVARLTATAAGMLIAGASIWYFGGNTMPQRMDVRTIHFVVQGVDNVSASSSSVVGDNMAAGFVSKGVYEKWFSFPDGPDGVLIRREQRWDISMTNKACSWLQDGNANYYRYGQDIVYITNEPLGVLILPTDPPEFTDFILEMVNANSLLEYKHDEETGLLVAKTDGRVASVGKFETVFEYNTLSQEAFEYNWPSDMKIVDERDQMHKRGWTYFRVKGQIGDTKVKGIGRIPFVYNKNKEHPAWLKINIGDNLQIIDASSGAYLLDSADRVTAAFASGSFFKGLGRPWLGIRAYDTLRRDAAEKRIRFKYNRNNEKAWVSLLEDHDYSHTKVKCDINMEKDIIETITYSITGDPEPLIGKLDFEYLDDVSDCGDEFVEPKRIECNLAVQEPMGVLWLLQLAQRNISEPVRLSALSINQNYE